PWAARRPSGFYARRHWLSAGRRQAWRYAACTALSEDARGCRRPPGEAGDRPNYSRKVAHRLPIWSRTSLIPAAFLVTFPSLSKPPPTLTWPHSSFARDELEQRVVCGRMIRAMATQSDVRIERQRASVDVEQLRAFFAEMNVAVTVEEVSPGPQASVDLFLSPVTDVITTFRVAHPLISAFLGSAVSVLTWETARKAAEKITERTIDVALDEMLKRIGERLLDLFRRSKDEKVTFYRGRQELLVPPVRLKLELYNPKVSKQGTLALVFPADLTDGDVREAIGKVGKVIIAALKWEERRGRFEQRFQRLCNQGKEAKAMAMLNDEKAHVWRRTPLTYAYKPDEAAWVDAWVLSDEGYKERRIAG